MSKRPWCNNPTRRSKLVTDTRPLNKKASWPQAGRLLLLCGLALMAGHAHAELYKWTDSQGKIHYSDQPPTVKTQTIKNPSAGQDETTSEAKKSLDARDQEFLKRKKDTEEARKKAEAEAEKERVQRENCAKARNNLSVLQNTPRVYTTNAAGQRVYMDEAARANSLAGSQKAISEFCK